MSTIERNREDAAIERNREDAASNPIPSSVEDVYNRYDPSWGWPGIFEERRTIAFPTHYLPDPVCDMVDYLSESLQTPDEMAGILSLGVLSTLFQGRYEIQVKPDWTEPLNLYTVAVAPPGERKSAVISALTAPIYEYEAEVRGREASELAKNQADRAMLEKALAQAQNEASTGKGDRSKKRDEVLALADELASFKERHPFRLLADDTTPEKLIQLLQLQDGRLTVASAEGGVFDSMRGRYDRSGNFDVYLKGHSGDPITVDRIGRSSNYIPSPKLTMMLAVQPDVLTGLMNDRSMRGRGLCGRFLYAVCGSKVGERNIEAHPLPPSVKQAYRDFVRSALESDDHGTIVIDEDADNLRYVYEQKIERRLADRWEHMRDWGGKLLGATFRIAGLIHASKHGELASKTLLDKDSVVAAIMIAECLCLHAEAAYQAMGGDDAVTNAKYLWKRIEGTGKEQLSKSELLHLCRGKFRRAADMEPAIGKLIDLGYIRRELIPTGNRPSEIILVNPVLVPGSR